MHLTDPAGIARRALELADAPRHNPSADASVVANDTTLGFGTTERRIVYGVVAAFCELFGDMFAEGVAIEAEEQHPDAATVTEATTAQAAAASAHDAAVITEMSYPELQSYAERHGVAKMNADTGKPRKKAELLADLGIESA